MLRPPQQTPLTRRPHVRQVPGVKGGENPDWAASQNNLGNALPELGERMGNRQVLEQAREAYACTQPITLHRNLRADRLIGSVFAGMLFGRGIATTFPYEAGAVLKTRPDLLAPDIQVHFMPALEHAANLYFPKPFGKPPLKETQGFSLRVGPINPESSGWVALRSADRADVPLIQPNHLQSEADCRTTIAGIRMVREVIGQPAFAGRIATRGTPRGSTPWTVSFAT